MKSIRVATYNIRKCVGLDWRRRPDRVMRVLASLHARIVVLQEADRRFGERLGTLPEDELFRVTGLKVVPVEDSGPSHGWRGNALLFGKGVKVKRVDRIALPSLEPRGALIADLVVDGTPLRIAGTHLGLRAANRRHQARALLDELKAREDGTREALLGDLNEWREYSGCVAILGRRLKPAPPRPSFHASAPVAALDRVFAGPGLRIEKVGVERSEIARRASDHLPVWADIEVESLPESGGAS